MSIEEQLDIIIEKLTILAGPSTGPAAVHAPTSGPVTGGPLVPDYDALAEAEDRDELLRLCKARNISIPPRTKNLTIVKKLKDWDAEQAGKQAGSASVGEESDPFAEGGDDDPFAESDPEVTYDMMMGALKDVHTAKGSAKVTELIMTFGGGVTKIVDVAEDKYADVYAEAVKAAK